MPQTPVKAAFYVDNAVPIQNSFRYKSHQNLNITATAETSAPINSETVIVTSSVYMHLAINHQATNADMLIPPGMWFLLIDKNSTISVVQSGTATGVCSLIIPEV